MKQSGVVSEDFKRVEAHNCPMSTCDAPVGSPCRTTKGKVAIQYHTARFRLVPQLAKVLNVPTPAVRKPGSVWAELPRPVNADAEPVGQFVSATPVHRPPGSRLTPSSTPWPRPG